MNVEKKFELIKRNTEEILGEEELKEMLKKGEKLKHYIGFEISGKIHLGTGLMCMLKVKDFMEATTEREKNKIVGTRNPFSYTLKSITLYRGLYA